MGKGGGTIGYHYLCSMLFGIGRGPVNALTDIEIGEKMAWSGNADSNEDQVLNRPIMFGGEQKEGGIQGIFRSLMGYRDQVIPGAVTRDIGIFGPYKKGTLPALRDALSPGDPDDVPEFRGRHMFWYDGLVSSMNPYIKEWKFRRWRTTAGWHNDQPWYPEKATVILTGEQGGTIHAMNPSHIIYQAATDPTLGRGQDPAELDEGSFVLAANTFCAENFGLCFQWMREDEVGSFIQSVCDHAGMVIYTDRETGLMNLKLIRNDYDPNNIPHFTPQSGLLSINEDDSGSSDEIADEIIINGKSPITDQQIQGRAHNLAVRLFRGGATTQTKTYAGLPTIELCNRVAERDRDMGAAGLRKFSVKLDRNGFRIHPGAVFKVSYPPRGLVNLVLRAGEIDDGSMLNGEITVSCVQDVFALPLTSFVTPVQNTWSPPSQDPVAAISDIIETSYRDIYRRLNTADLENIDASTSQFATLVRQPSITASGYDLRDRAAGGTWPTSGDPQFFTASCLLNGAVSAMTTVFTVDNLSEFPDDEDLPGQALYVGGEYVRVDSFNPDTGTFTVTRGCVDTWPKAHADNSRVWLVDDDIGYIDDHVYLPGEVVEAKALTRTGSELLTLEAAPLMSLEMNGRVFRPYPPARVRVDGTSIYSPSTADGREPVLSWVTRNRLTQADVLVGFEEPGVTAEAGTTYRAEIYNAANELKGVHDGIASPWTYTYALQAADGMTAATAYVRLFAVRDGVKSLDQFAFKLMTSVSGYGLQYGLNYGKE